MHLARVGTGIVRDVRNGDRIAVEIKGRTMIVAAAQLSHADRVRTPTPSSVVPEAEGPPAPGAARRSPRTLDLHGRTAVEAVEALDAFLNDALLAGDAVVHVIHGRSGGRVKQAVHARLRAVPSVQRYALDPRNPGVTIVML